MEIHFDLYCDEVIEYLENQVLQLAKYPNSKISHRHNPKKIINTFNFAEIILLNAYSLDIRLCARRYFIKNNNLVESYLQILNTDLAKCNYCKLSVAEKVNFLIAVFTKFDALEKNKFCTEFSICRFMTIIDFLKPKSILDLCAGWGDRCIGAKLRNVRYVGVDPNYELRFCYQSINYGKMIYEPAETLSADFLLGYNMFQEYDMVFCSPPFFNYEIYSNDSVQSIAKFATYDIWLNEFIFKMVQLAKSVLNKNGYFVMYVGDIKIYDEVYFMFSDCLKYIKKNFSVARIVHLHRVDNEKNLGKFRKMIIAKI